MAHRPLAVLLLACLAGCTLIDLSQLGGGSGAGQTGGESSAGNGPSGGNGPETGGGPQGASSGVTQGGGPMGGAPPGESYLDCLLLDAPAVYFRANSPEREMMEPNLGSLGGNGIHGGITNTHVPFPGLIDDDDLSTQFIGSSGEGSLNIIEGGETLFGGYKPFSVEMWLKIPVDIGETSLLDYHIGNDLLELRLRERFDVQGDDTLELHYIEDTTQERYLIVPLDLQDPPEQLLHVVAVYRQTAATVFAGDGSADDMLIYVNGALEDYLATGAEIPVPQMSASLSLANGFGGLVDEIAIYGKELSAGDVARHYAFGMNAALGCDGQ